jgi:hypothetical protein
VIRGRSVVAACAALLVASCGGGTAQPAVHAAPPPPATPGEALARAVFDAAGGAHLAEVGCLRFHFVVVRDGAVAADIAHAWDLRAARDHVTWTEDGHAVDLVEDLAARTTLSATVDGATATRFGEEELASVGYERWVNDTYWLLVPLKVLDPGVHVAREPDRDGKEVLHLSFEHVGLTPGDQYWLLVDPASHHVTGWEMQLEGEQPPPRAMSFDAHTQVGPLVLALSHANHEGTRVVRLDDVHATPAACD